MVNVAYACNEAYIEQTTVSMKSLYENAKNASDICIFFIDMGTKKESRDSFAEMAKEYGATFHAIDFSDIAYDLNISQETGRHIKSVYAKFFLGRIDNIVRILYLDSDVVITGAIEDLYYLELGDYVCAGVETIHTIKDNEQIGYTKEERAINDGVVLIDLRKWRERDYLKRCLEYIGSCNGEPPVLSEGTINVVCKGDIKIIDPRYNLLSGLVNADVERICKLTQRSYYSQQQVNAANENPVIIHFLSGFYNRPWCRKCTHPYKHEYLRYRSMTSFHSCALSKKKLPIRLKLISVAMKYLPVEVISFLRR